MQLMILETTQTVPLTVWKDGSIRVKGSRLLVDIIINSHQCGECPEHISESFPAVSVAEVYAIIAYYLTHKAKFEKYLAKREKEAEEIKKRIESLPNYRERGNQIRKMLIIRQQNRNLKQNDGI